MAADYEAAYRALRDVFTDVLPELQVTTDNNNDYQLSTRLPSPLPQHKGAPMYFGGARKGKAYASFHLFPLYIDGELAATISPELRKRMQGKSCFNFKAPPDPGQTAELGTLTKAGLQSFKKKTWA